MQARELIEAARDLARKSRDMLAEPLRLELCRLPIGAEARHEMWKAELQNRMTLVMDCYLTGCEETLKRLMGDPKPEPFHEDYDHEARLKQLLELFTTLQPAAEVLRPQVQ